jgi:hypothetical protein
MNMISSILVLSFRVHISLSHIYFLLFQTSHGAHRGEKLAFQMPTRPVWMYILYGISEADHFRFLI